MTDERVDPGFVENLTEQLRRLQGTRRMDRFMQWVAGIAGAVVTLAIAGLVATVLDLKSSVAVSNAKLEGAIDRLSERLEAASLLADNSLNVLRLTMQNNSARLNDHETRIRGIENALRVPNPRRRGGEP